MISIRTDLIDPHVYLDCKLKFHREIVILHGLARNYCLLKDWINYFKAHYNQSYSTTRRRLKEMASLKIIAIHEDKSTYIQLLSNGLSYMLNKKVGNPKPIQNNIPLEKSHVILNHCRPTLVLIRKGKKRNQILSEKTGCTEKQAQSFFAAIEQRHIYIREFAVPKHRLKIKLLQYDPYNGIINPFYKINLALNGTISLFNLPYHVPIELEIIIASKYRVTSKQAFAKSLDDHYSNDYQSLKSYCNQKNSLMNFTFNNLEKSKIQVNHFNIL